MSAVLNSVRSNLDDAKPATDGWPPLDALPDLEATRPNPFPVDALGPIMGPATIAMIRDVQAPDSLVAGSVLSAAGLASSPLANVHLPHGQRSPLSLFVVTVAVSGDRKSAADSVSCHPIEEMRKEQAREYTRQMQEYEDEVAARKKGDGELKPPAPHSITTGNATVEGLMKLLRFQSIVGVFSAEGGEMLGGHSMREDRRMSALAVYLKAWSGESLDSLRGGEGLMVLLGRRLNMHLMIQPVVAHNLLSDPLAQGQGFLARCLIAEPETLAGHRPYRQVNPLDDLAVVAFHDRIRRLLAMPTTVWPEGDGYELKPRDLRLDPDATRLWVAFYNSIEAAQASGSELEGARPFASKAAEHAARIAGVVKLVNEPDATHIDAQTMDGALQVTGFYLGEHLRLTGCGLQERKDGALRMLLDWMQRAGSVIAKKDVLQRSPRALGRNAKAINPMLDELVERGYIRERDGQWEVRDV